jgi:hypothetical protein
MTINIWYVQSISYDYLEGYDPRIYIKLFTNHEGAKKYERSVYNSYNKYCDNILKEYKETGNIEDGDIYKTDIVDFLNNCDFKNDDEETIKRKLINYEFCKIELVETNIDLSNNPILTLSI